MPNRLAVAESCFLLLGPLAPEGIGIRGCKGSTDIAPLISTPMSEGLAGKMRALRLGGGRGRAPRTQAWPEEAGWFLAGRLRRGPQPERVLPCPACPHPGQGP